MPVDWLKREWKARRLLRHVHLTISGCLGPCDVANVVWVVAGRRSVWLGGLNAFAEYAALLEWSEAAAGADRLPPLPACLRRRAFSRFRDPS